MEIISKKISGDELNKMDSGYFEDKIKAVVDIEKQIIGVDAELHADIEGALIEEGSELRNLWGINFLADEDEIEEFVKFDSLINIHPKQNNRSRDVEDENIRNKILEAVEKWIEIQENISTGSLRQRLCKATGRAGKTGRTGSGAGGKN